MLDFGVSVRVATPKHVTDDTDLFMVGFRKLYKGEFINVRLQTEEHDGLKIGTITHTAPELTKIPAIFSPHSDM